MHATTTLSSAAVIAVLLLLTEEAHGFSINALGRRRVWLPLSAGASSSDTGGGAGSWRSKAKQFKDKPEGWDDSKKLNIAFVTGNAMKQREINLILSNNAATSSHDGESFVNLKILDVDLPE